jgi:hypothetical protein
MMSRPSDGAAATVTCADTVVERPVVSFTDGGPYVSW